MNIIILSQKWVCSSTKMKYFLVYLLVLTMSESEGLRAVEYLSTFVNILCNLDRQFHPLYWMIQDRIYDLYNVPEIFTERTYGGITLPTVDRRMDGWRFQCFTIEPSNEDNINPGEIRELTVIYGMHKVSLM